MRRQLSDLSVVDAQDIGLVARFFDEPVDHTHVPASFQCRMASASASLSSTGSKPRLRASSIIRSFFAAPLPVQNFLIVPTGTPSYGIFRSSHHDESSPISPP